MTEAPIPSANFAFLARHDVQLVRLGALAERYFRDDPNTCLIKLPQFGEVLAQLVAAKAGLFRSQDEAQSDLLRRLSVERITPREVVDLFHQLRMTGNRATHDLVGNQTDALTALKVARQLGVWFHRTFADIKGFKVGPFVPPPDPAGATEALHVQLARLRDELVASRTAAEQSRIDAEEHQRSRLSAEERRRNWKSGRFGNSWRPKPTPHVRHWLPRLRKCRPPPIPRRRRSSLRHAARHGRARIRARPSSVVCPDSRSPGSARSSPPR